MPKTEVAQNYLILYQKRIEKSSQIITIYYIPGDISLAYSVVCVCICVVKQLIQLKIKLEQTS